VISRRVGAALLATLVVCAGLLLQDDANESLVQSTQRVAGRNTPNADRSTDRPADRAEAAAALVARGAWHAPSALAVAAWSGPSRPAEPPPAPRAMPRAAPEPLVPPAAAPRAPGFGFKLIGTVAEAGGTGALLSSPQRSLWVRAGDTVDSAWRVLRIDAGGVDLLWLPQQLPARIDYSSP
jgi:hypothetical protein